MSSEKQILAELRIDRDARPKRGFPVWLAVLLLLGLAGGAAWVMKRARPSVVPVRTMIVRNSGGSGDRVVLNASGYVTPRRLATVSSKVTGKVQEVMVEEGMKVTAGQVLARLDQTNVRANLELAEAQLAAAKSALTETQVRLEEADRELRRIHQLSQERIATASELDRAQAEVNSLKARLERQQVEVTVAERQLALWQQQMDDTIIRAPFAGIVVAKNAQPGEMISPVSAGGGFTRTGICTVVDMESLEIEVDVNESYINRVQPAQQIEATLDAYPQWKIPGRVIAIIPTADREKSTVKVRVGFEKLDPRILPDMGVKVAFRGGAEAQATPAFFVPRTAVKQEGESNAVFVAREGKAVRHWVNLGEARGGEVAVISGLADGENIIVSGLEKLEDGISVREAKR